MDPVSEINFTYISFSVNLQSFYSNNYQLPTNPHLDYLVFERSGQIYAS